MAAHDACTPDPAEAAELAASRAAQEARQRAIQTDPHTSVEAGAVHTALPSSEFHLERTIPVVTTMPPAAGATSERDQANREHANADGTERSRAAANAAMRAAGSKTKQLRFGRGGQLGALAAAVANAQAGGSAPAAAEEAAAAMADATSASVVVATDGGLSLTLNRLTGDARLAVPGRRGETFAVDMPAVTHAPCIRGKWRRGT